MPATRRPAAATRRPTTASASPPRGGAASAKPVASAKAPARGGAKRSTGSPTGKAALSKTATRGATMKKKTKTTAVARPVAAPRATASQKADKLDAALLKTLQRRVAVSLGRTHPLVTLLSHHGLSAATALGLGAWLEHRLSAVTPDGDRLVGLRLADRIQHALDRRVLTQDSLHYARHIQGERNRFAHDVIAPGTIAPRVVLMISAALVLETMLPPSPKARPVRRA